MKYIETILESGLLSEISKSERIYAFESLEVFGETFEKDQVLFSAGEVIDRICIVESGYVREEKVYEDGEVCIIHTYSDGAVFGVEAAVSRKKTAATDFVCNENTTIVFIPFKNIEKSKWAKEIMTVLLQKLADENFRHLYKVGILARRGVRERILLYLDNLQKRAKSNIVRTRLDREQMAQFLCVNRSSLSYELHKLKQEGFIEFTKDEFKILK